MVQNGDARETQRLDKWLWHARIIKSRSLAAQLVASGKFRVNREKILKPAFCLKSGDVITTALFGKLRVLQVVGFSDRRGPAVEARALYQDLTPEDPPRAA
ncbi:MAG: RNA-binding S4 domain-containing protein [Hyphomicrobiales bacterium]|nr:RNA-binding S4 domain-containing protein [Hyphomicrobiales bacterium]